VRLRPTHLGLAAVHGPKEEEDVWLWTFRACPQTSVPTGASHDCGSTSWHTSEPGQFLARIAGFAPVSADMPSGTILLANVSAASVSVCSKLVRLLGKIHRLIRCAVAP